MVCDFCKTLDIIFEHNKGQNFLTPKNRGTLNDRVKDIACVDAKNVYSDLCYLYICAVSTTAVDVSRLKIFKHAYHPKFIISVVEIGPLLDKISDASILDAKGRRKKWRVEEENNERIVEIHAERECMNYKWSSFLYRSRDKNKIAYDRIVNELKASDEIWHQIVLQPISQLQQQPPLFFQHLTINKLTIPQKRAVLHKLTLVYQALPICTRDTMQRLQNDIFQSEMCVQVKVRPNCFCTVQ